MRSARIRWLTILTILALPWIVLTALVRSVVLVARLARRSLFGPRSHVLCPAHHPNALFGRWRCACGATWMGTAAGPCPHCGLPCGTIECERCGLTISLRSLFP